jgi:hypothetical protein
LEMISMEGKLLLIINRIKIKYYRKKNERSFIHQTIIIE